MTTDSRYKVILCSTPSDLKAALQIRIDVFHKEQGFPLDTEVDEYDPQSAHFLLIDVEENNKPLGTLRWVPYPPPAATTQHTTASTDESLSLGEPLSTDTLKQAFLQAGNGKLGRLALVSSTRGKGLGKKIVKDSEEWLGAILKRDAVGDTSNSKANVTLRLHSQMQVIPFYEALGYRQSGKPFDEDGAPHMLCTKEVSV